MWMLSTLQQLQIYIYIFIVCVAEEKRGEKESACVHLSQKLSLLSVGESPPSQLSKTAVIFISGVSLHFAHDDLLFAYSAAEAIFNYS